MNEAVSTANQITPNGTKVTVTIERNEDIEVDELEENKEEEE